MSRHCPKTSVVVWCSVVACAGPPWVTAAEFRPVAEVRWSSDSRHWGVSLARLSGNGQVVIGSSNSGAAGDFQAWRWTPAGGFEWLPLPVPQEEWYWDGCVATALSADGSKIFMSCQVDEHHSFAIRIDDIQAYRYENGIFYGLERPHDEAYVIDVTPDGALGVGYDIEKHQLFPDTEFRPYRWDGYSATELSWLSAGNCGTGDDDDAMAIAVSDDGSVMIGKSGETWDYARPVVWTNGAISRLDPYGPECGVGSWFFELIRGLSGNGRIAVGAWNADWAGAAPTEPVYWTVPTRVRTALPVLGAHVGGTAGCTTADGGLIGGRCWMAAGASTAVRWNRINGTVEDVADVLSAAGIVAHSGWQLYDVIEMSSDGKKMIGTGLQPNGQAWIWWADLTNPPKNDTCADAATLVTNTSPYVMDTQTHTVSGTTRDASWDGGASCASTAHLNTNIWYKFTAPVDGYLMLDLCNSPPGLLDEFLSVHTGCPGTAANEILCMTDCPHRRDCGWPCVEPPELLIPAGQTRYVQVGGWSDEGHDVQLSYRFLPINDDCTDAFSVGHDPSSTQGSTENMTVDTGADCQGVNATAPGVWYTVLGTGSTMTASTCGQGGDANFDTQISVFCSGCGGMTCVAANDDGLDCAGAAVRHSSVSWCSAPGALYHILVHGYGAESGIFELAVRDDGQSCPFAINCHPPNETCEQAISVSDGTMMSDNTGAGTNVPIASCAASTNDIWFHYVTRCDGQLWVDTCQLGLGSMDDSVVSFYDGCSGVELACNDDYQDATINCQHRSAAIGAVDQNRDILIRVAGYGPNQLNQGTFPLRVSEVAAPLQILSSTMPDGYLGVAYAQRVISYGSCGRRFTTATGLPPGLSVDLYTGLVSGTPQSAGDFTVHVEVANNDISHPEWVAGDVTLRIWPTNDACANAFAVSEGLHYFGNAGATTDGPNEPIMCTDGSGDAQIGSDVWYRYTSSCDGRATVDLCGSSYDTKLAVYQGPLCPAGEGAIICNDDACGVQSRIELPVAIGSEYLIRIGGFHAQQGTGQMLLSCMNDCNGNLISDAEELARGAESDCNFNARPDSCDVRGDYNASGRLDLADWPVALRCLWGPCRPGTCSPASLAAPCCAWIDFDNDHDVDLRDVANLQRRYR